MTETNASGCIGSTLDPGGRQDHSLAPASAPLHGSSLNYTGGAGVKFILLSSPDIRVIPSSWTRLLTNTTTPGSFIIPTVTGVTNLFYRIKSE